MTWTPPQALLVSEPYSAEVVEWVPGSRPAAPPTQHVLLTGLTRPGRATAGACRSPQRRALERDQPARQPAPPLPRLLRRRRQRLRAGDPGLRQQPPAPLGLDFHEGSKLAGGLTDGAVLAAHGSWDREPPGPRAVLWMPWSSAAHALGSPVTLISGFRYPNGSRWGRPVDALPEPDGSLCVSDDTAGAVYRLPPSGGADATVGAQWPLRLRTG
jgi:hypothetical protein